MKKQLLILALALMCGSFSCTNAQQPTQQMLTVNRYAQPKREFRGAWMQCVNGMYLGKTPQQIRDMLTSQLNVLQRVNINAIIFQVRPEGDALYRSNYEPWSRYLTGQQGVPPEDGWDPLQWMIEQCHARGMECHAWINPYRMKTKNTTQLASSHPAVQHPDWVIPYGDLLILNPALEMARLHTCVVVEDILRHYDVDGIHMDDYFYPYPEGGMEFNDIEYYNRDPRGFNTLADWRRDNVNMLVRDLHNLIREVKPWVKFGISPFGIYRNDKSGQNTAYGSATNGLQNYDDLYADVLKWEQEGWVDYLVPQVYWNFGTKAADYGILLNWWNDNCKNRPVYIGQDVERTVKGQDLNDPTKHQMDAKYRLQRQLPNIQGSCQWYAAAVASNPGNYATILEKVYHPYPALQPRMPFIDNEPPKAPKKLKVKLQNGITVLSWRKDKLRKEMNKAISYVIYDFPPNEIIDLENPAAIRAITRNNSVALQGDFYGHTILVTALDHLHNESLPAILKLE